MFHISHYVYCDHLFFSVKCDFTLDDQYIFLLHCQLIICFDGIFLLVKCTQIKHLYVHTAVCFVRSRLLKLP